MRDTANEWMNERQRGSQTLTLIMPTTFFSSSFVVEKCWYFRSIKPLSQSVEPTEIITRWNVCMFDSVQSNRPPLGLHSACRLNVDSQAVSRVLFTALFVVDVAKQHLHSSAFKLGELGIDPSCQWSCICRGRRKKLLWLFRENSNDRTAPTRSQLRSVAEQMTRGYPQADASVNRVHKENRGFCSVCGSACDRAVLPSNTAKSLDLIKRLSSQ